MNQMPRVRLKHLSFELGLSQTTVSRALAGYSDVSKETRERVIAAAHRTGYFDIRAARRRTATQSGFVGMLLPLQDDGAIEPNVSLFMAGLSDQLMRHARTLLLATVAPGQDSLVVLRHLIDRQQADAVVMHCLTYDDPGVRFLMESEHPFVTLGRMLVPHLPFPWFDLDAEAAFREATQLLLDLGHRDFATFGPSEPFSYAALRQRGIRSTLQEAGLGLPPDRVVTVPFGESRAIEAAAHALLARRDAPTAVLAIQDKYGLALLRAARERGIEVPRDLSVIGFGDIPGAQYAQPALSTFDQHARQCGRMVADMVISRIEGGELRLSRLMEADFVPRGSHGPAPSRLERRASRQAVHALAAS
jgi:LacI family transcriptional regulator